jgi:argininosuccinate lyase
MQSGYNRDLQLTKEALIESFEIAVSTLNMFRTIIEKIKVNRKKCIEACTKELFTAEHAYGLVKKGTSFRDAYKETAKNMKNLPKIDPVKNIKSKKHLGATGNLGLVKLNLAIKSANAEVDSEIKNFSSKLEKLTG